MAMGGDASGKARPRLHEVKPRELKGRDTIARFQAQFRAAALASLEILKGAPIDRIYCDYQEDFVAREQVENEPTYHFVQVKTKGSAKYQWPRTILFGVSKKIPAIVKGAHGPGGASHPPPTAEQLDKVRSSFVGRLLEHTVAFGDTCGSVTFLTNAHLEDDVEEIARAISSGELSERTLRYLADNFSAIFKLSQPLPMSTIHAYVCKLRFDAGQSHLDPHHEEFASKATAAVFKYSEVDLSHTEGTELIAGLLALIQRKSSKKLTVELTSDDLDDAAGVGIDELLDLLPISRGAYRHFLKMGDAQALRNSSILQRKLGQAGATAELIEAASRWKIDWDNWLRTNRHLYEREVNFLQLELNQIYRRWMRGQVSFGALPSELNALKAKLSAGLLGSNLTDEILTGGVLAELVRGESR